MSLHFSHSLLLGDGISFAKVLELFVRCNQDELENYGTGDMPDPTDIKAMALDFHEFTTALLATAALKQKTGGDFPKLLDTFIEGILLSGPKHF